MRTSKVALVVGLVAFVVALVSASGAQAAKMTCVFNGATGNIDPAESPDGVDPTTGLPAAGDHFTDTGVQSRMNDNSDGVLEGDWDGGGYTFSTQNTAIGRAVCIDSGGISTGHITSKGHYNNRVCGTGTAIDDDNPANEITTVDLDSPTAQDITDAEYQIDFSDFRGDLDITNVNGSPEIDPPGPPDGYVTIAPDKTFAGPPPPGDCVTQDVTRFLASGNFTATW